MRDHWDAGRRRVKAQLPTGGGKTVVFSNIAHKEFVKQGDPVLVVAHREELLLQAKGELEAETEQQVGIIKAGYQATPEALIQVASIQTLTRRQQLPRAKLLIIDESHHSAAASYIKLMEHYSDSCILGCTATPARIDGRGFKNLYDALVLGPSVAELIKEKYLCPFRLFAAQNTINTSGVRTTGGDFNQRDLEEAIDTSLVMGDLIETWQKYALGKKTVVFAVSVAHSQAIALAYQAAGISAEHLDGDTPSEERTRILDRFRTGETLVLTNCGIISEGFNVPSIEAIQCVRPTKSLILWLQMVGRCLRFVAEKCAIIIDHTQNWTFHGLPDEEREWSLEPISLESRRWALQCPACQHIFIPFPRERENLLAICPNCDSAILFEESGEGSYFISNRVLIEDKQAQIEEVTSTPPRRWMVAKLNQLNQIRLTQGYRPIWVYNTFLSACPEAEISELLVCAQMLGYRPEWAWYRWREIQEHRNRRE